jgi:hypothetical protein
MCYPSTFSLHWIRHVRLLQKYRDHLQALPINRAYIQAHDVVITQLCVFSEQANLVSLLASLGWGSHLVRHYFQVSRNRFNAPVNLHPNFTSNTIPCSEIDTAVP